MTNRRNFLGHAAAATLAAPILAHAATPQPAPLPAGTPIVNKAATTTGPVVLKVQSSFPESEMLNGFGEQWAKRVNALGGGELKIEFLPVGAVAKAFAVTTAVSQGKLDGGHSRAAYLHEIHPAFSLWCTGPAFGMDSPMLLAWHQYGGGKELLAELYKAVNMNIVGIAYMPLANQPLGWFKKDIAKVEDLKGMKFRTAGLAMDIMQELGVDTMTASAAEIGPLIQSGKIDGGEYNNMTSDKAVGLNKYAKYCLIQSYSEATGCMELVFNSKVWNGLTPEHRMLIETVANAMSTEGSWQTADQNSADYQSLAETGTKFIRTPPPILQAQLNAWDRVVARYASKDPLFASVIKSQKEFAKRAGRWESDVTVNYRTVQNHYFSRRSV